MRLLLPFTSIVIFLSLFSCTMGPSEKDGVTTALDIIKQAKVTQVK